MSIGDKKRISVILAIVLFITAVWISVEILKKGYRYSDGINSVIIRKLENDKIKDSNIICAMTKNKYTEAELYTKYADLIVKGRVVDYNGIFECENTSNYGDENISVTYTYDYSYKLKLSEILYNRFENRMLREGNIINFTCDDFQISEPNVGDEYVLFLYDMGEHHKTKFSSDYVQLVGYRIMNPDEHILKVDDNVLEFPSSYVSISAPYLLGEENQRLSKNSIYVDSFVEMIHQKTEKYAGEVVDLN